jgi:thiosulfate dehydrogenase [quinone] large subunit
MNTSSQSDKFEYSAFQLTGIVILRLVIGWHFLYEGVIKIFNPNWSAAGFLNDSQGPFSGLFYWMANDQMILNFLNVINMWMLTLIGLCLIIGIFERYAYYGGFLLLLMYYLAAPPWPGLTYNLPKLDNHLIIDRNLIEMAAILVLIAFPSCQIIGLDRLLNKILKRQSNEK